MHALATQVWALALVAISGLALWRGGRPERIFALINLVAWLATVLLVNRRDLGDPQWGMFAVDTLMLAAMLWLSLTTQRFWILPATAFQLLTVVTHLAIMVDHGVRIRAYLAGLAIWSWLVLGCLGAAVLARARAGRDPAAT
ncbi:hypothetical protein [Phenylobacterium aquaticum]|uniref:hypothetical protein n=1 Tax=Phenylobacterium aquaticum TaxID=1763816 RepID=UPI0026F2A990|nr:hypothetical protein [Phenylobacterium aquaticum]